MPDRVVNLLIAGVCLMVAAWGAWRLAEHYMGLR